MDIYLGILTKMRDQINDAYDITERLQNKLWEWDKELEYMIDDLEAEKKARDEYCDKMEIESTKHGEKGDV